MSAATKENKLPNELIWLSVDSFPPVTGEL